MISRFQAGMKKRSICSGVAWLSIVGRNIPKWRSKGSGLSRCTHLDQAARESSVDDGDGNAWKGRGESHKGIDEKFTFIDVQTGEKGRKDKMCFIVNPRKRLGQELMQFTWERNGDRFECKQARGLKTNKKRSVIYMHTAQVIKINYELITFWDYK